MRRENHGTLAGPLNCADPARQRRVRSRALIVLLDFLRQLAQALFAIGNYPDAAFVLRRGMQLLPDWPVLGEDPRTRYLDAADHEEQLLALRTFLEFLPDDPASTLVLAVQYYWNATAYLIDPGVMALEPWQAIAISVVTLLAGWLIYDGLCRSLAARSGCLVAAVDYRLAPEHPFPAAYEDAWAATVWLAERGDSLGARPGALDRSRSSVSWTSRASSRAAAA